MKVLLSALVLMLFASYHSIAQPQGGPQPQNPPAVPITGIEILLVGGGAYGIYRLTKKTGNKNKEI